MPPPVFDIDPGDNPKAAGTLTFGVEGQDSAFSWGTDGSMTAAGFYVARPDEVPAGSPFKNGGEAMCDRRFSATGNAPNGAGNVQLSLFRASRTEDINSVTQYTTGTAASGTTLARMGVYEIDEGRQTLTLVAATANDTTLFSSVYNIWNRNFTSTWRKQAGKLYAGANFIAATAQPTYVNICAQGAGLFDTILNVEPGLFKSMTGQTDLPSSFSYAALANSRRSPYFEFYP